MFCLFHFAHAHTHTQTHALLDHFLLFCNEKKPRRHRHNTNLIQWHFTGTRISPFCCTIFTVKKKLFRFGVQTQQDEILLMKTNIIAKNCYRQLHWDQRTKRAFSTDKVENVSKIFCCFCCYYCFSFWWSLKTHRDFFATFLFRYQIVSVSRCVLCQQNQNYSQWDRKIHLTFTFSSFYFFYISCDRAQYERTKNLSILSPHDGSFLFTFFVPFRLSPGFYRKVFFEQCHHAVDFYCCLEFCFIVFLHFSLHSLFVR